MAGDVDELRSAHLLLQDVGGADSAGVSSELARHTVVECHTSAGRTSALVRPGGPVSDQWQSRTPDLEELLLPYLRSLKAPPLITPAARVPARPHSPGGAAA